MKTNRIKSGVITLIGFLAFLVISGGIKAQQKLSDVRVVVRDVWQEQDSIRAILDIEVTGMSVASREQIYLFPVIRFGRNKSKMLPVVISGRTQWAVVRRSEKLSGKVEPVYARFTTRGKSFQKQVAYNAAVPLEAWMRDADVAMVQERKDCCGDFHHFSVEVIADRIRFAERPERTIVYDLPVNMPVPPREEIKTRTESGEAQIHYLVGKADINPALGNNQNELDKIHSSIEDVKKLQGVKINSIMIASYASPEGTWQSNLRLSEHRAASLVEWIRRNYDLTKIQLNSKGNGEDWKGLAELVKTDPVMTAAEKEFVQGVIESSTVPDGREKSLMRYSGGKIYHYLLSTLFPRLRRSAYLINFTIPEYSVETVKEVYKTNPKMLSLYEFYLLANQYDPDTPEFREVIQMAAKVFPNEKLSRISLAMTSYSKNNMPSALAALNGLEDDPEAWLYFSAVHARMGDLDKAAYYARRASDAGNPDASLHLERIEKYKVDEEKYQQELKNWEQYGTNK